MTQQRPSNAALLALLDLPGIGHRKGLRIALTHPDLDQSAPEGLGLDEWRRSLGDAHRSLEKERVDGIEAIGFFDSRYPDSLRSIADPPLLLWVLGETKLLQSMKSVAIVGTREPTAFGRDAAWVISTAVASAGWCVVSGLARGIDTVAHHAAIKATGTTAAVMAGGLDSVYPADNKELAKRIVERGGALISETPPTYRPRASSFVARDRLQVALSKAVVVCQTGRSGGSLHTARFAVEQGRPIFCPQPQHPIHDKSEGIRLLLEAPGSRLCDEFPEWSASRELCSYLGSQPAARAIAGANAVHEFVSELNDLVDLSVVPELGPDVKPSEEWADLLKREDPFPEDLLTSDTSRLVL